MPVPPRRLPIEAGCLPANDRWKNWCPPFCSEAAGGPGHEQRRFAVCARDEINVLVGVYWLVPITSVTSRAVRSPSVATSKPGQPNETLSRQQKASVELGGIEPRPQRFQFTVFARPWGDGGACVAVTPAGGKHMPCRAKRLNEGIGMLRFALPSRSGGVHDSRTQQSSRQNRLHVASTVRDQVDEHLGADDAVDHPIGLERGLSVFLDA